jgi:hypothetical protein
MVEPFFRRPLSEGGTAARPQLGSGGGHYDPNQPRVPAGQPDGGQWTNKGGESAGPGFLPERSRSLDEIISDAIDDAIVERDTRRYDVHKLLFSLMAVLFNLR